MSSLPMATAIEPVPPLAHAVGGSLGSALGLLLLYPLERVRIEMQSMAALRPVYMRGREGGREEAESTLLLSARRKSPQSESPDSSAGSTNSWITAGTNEDVFEPASNVSMGSTECSKITIFSSLQSVLDRGELYTGAGPIVATLATSNFVFFYVNAWMKLLLGHNNTQKASTAAYRSLWASCLAGVLNVLVTNPLWVTNLRIVTKRTLSSSLPRELCGIARSEGISALWKGTFISMWLVSNPVIQFFTYEQLKQARLVKQRHQRLTPFEAFVLGALAKALATLMTYPLQLTQSVLRLQQNDQYRGVVDCLWGIYRRDGILGLFTGLRAKLLQTVLTAAFTFLTYEQILGVAVQVISHYDAMQQRTNREKQ